MIDTQDATLVATDLTPKMIATFGTGHALNHSAKVIGPHSTVEALRRRGLIGDDSRWTTLGFKVASLVLGGRVRSIDELHADALIEDAACGCLRNPLGHARAEHPA